MYNQNIRFGKPYSIAIYNFDVNDLKYINDHYGHEYGDKLIINAAKSVSAICGDNIYGYRMGGDEFLATAFNISHEEAEIILIKWQSALAEINAASKDVFVSISCGMVYGSGNYDYDKLYEEADKLMYTEKQMLKSQGTSSFIIPPKEND